MNGFKFTRNMMIILLLLSTSVISTIKQLIALQDFHASEISLQKKMENNQLIRINPKENQIRQTIDETTLLDKVMQSAQQAELSNLNEKSLSKQHDQDHSSIALTAIGQPIQFINFMSHLSQDHLIYFINRFYYESHDEHIYTTSIQLTFLKIQSAAEDNTHSSLLPNQIEIAHPTPLSHIPIHQLRYSGYLIENHHIHAIIMLPNGESITAQNGDSIGTEQEEIIRITDNIIYTHGLSRLTTHRMIMAYYQHN